MNPFYWLAWRRKFSCTLDARHKFSLSGGWPHCIFCEKTLPADYEWGDRVSPEELMRKELAKSGHRPNQTDNQGRAGALPAGASRERPGGAELPAPAGAAVGAGAGPEPVAQEIIAWRSWLADQEEPGRLLSHNKTAWEGPVLKADKIPAVAHEHGVYALRSREKLVEMGYDNCITGEVALSGIVLEGERGYRAECATIRKLQVRFLVPAQYIGGVYAGWVKPEDRLSFPEVCALDFLTRLEARYQCPVEVLQWPTAPAARADWHRVQSVRVVTSNSSQGASSYLEAL